MEDSRTADSCSALTLAIASTCFRTAHKWICQPANNGDTQLSARRDLWRPAVWEIPARIGHLRFHYNVAKRMLIHVAGFNLGLLIRKRFGVGTPRGPQGRLAAVIAACALLADVISALLTVTGRPPHPEERADINSGWLTPDLVTA
jgi:hypothetical protein